VAFRSAPKRPFLFRDEGIAEKKYISYIVIVSLNYKKRLSFFLSPFRMSLTKLFLAGNY
jgi:hypothetical protein